MKNIKWLYLIVLALTWGSSFILIKKALIGFDPIEIGALRIIISGILLFFIGFKKLKYIEKKYWKPLFIVAIFGTFFPVFLFSYAITEIDSSIAAVLNSLTPLITMVLGVLFFQLFFLKKTNPWNFYWPLRNLTPAVWQCLRKPKSKSFLCPTYSYCCYWICV